MDMIEEAAAGVDRTTEATTGNLVIFAWNPHHKYQRRIVKLDITTTTTFGSHSLMRLVKIF